MSGRWYVLVAITVAIAGCAPTAGPLVAQPAPAQEVRFAVLADTHVGADPDWAFDGVRPYASLKLAVEKINALKPAPSEVIVLGDLAVEGKADQYRSYLDALSGLTVGNVRHLLGNHDQYPAFRSVVLSDKAGPPPGTWPPPQYRYAWDAGAGWRMIAMDTRRGGQTIGELSDSQLSWLSEQASAAGDRNVLVFMHHHPIRTDNEGIIDPDRLWKVVAEHPNIRAIFCGHLHEFGCQQRAGVHVVSAPTTAWCVDPAANRGLLMVTAGAKSLTVRFVPLGDVAGAAESVRTLTW